MGIEKNYRGLACGKISSIYDIVYKFKARMESFKSLSSLTVLKIGRSPVLHDTDALCNPQETLCNPQQSLCNLQPTLCNPPQTLCNPQQMLCSPPQTLCNLQPTLCNPLQTLCNPQQMLCNPPQTLCNLQPTLCNPLQTHLCRPTSCRGRSLVEKRKTSMSLVSTDFVSRKERPRCPLCRPTSCREKKDLNVPCGGQKYARSISVIW